jgi:hypothetical protein
MKEAGTWIARLPPSLKLRRPVCEPVEALAKTGRGHELRALQRRPSLAFARRACIMPRRRRRMAGKIALEEHFATEATLGDSRVFGAHVWGSWGLASPTSRTSASA